MFADMSRRQYNLLIWITFMLGLGILVTVVLHSIAEANGDPFFKLWEDGSFRLWLIYPEVSVSACLPLELCMDQTWLRLQWLPDSLWAN